MWLLSVAHAAPLPMRIAEPRRHRVPPPAPADADVGGWDVSAMEVELWLDVVAGTLRGEATIRATKVGEGALVLHASTFTPDWTLDGAPVLPTQDGSRALFTPSGDTATVTASWNTIGNPWFGLVTVDDVLFATNEPESARSWMPCHDIPTDRATIDWTFHVPAPYSVAAIGDLVAEDVAAGTWHYRMDTPVPTYLMAFHAAEYTRDEQPGDIPVWTWAHPDDLDDALVVVQDTPAMLDWLAERLGPYPWNRYGNAFVPMSGAMENPGAVTMSEDYLDAPDYGALVNMHEATHHWFGDHVTVATWADLWLNEGFATYGEVLWWEHLYGDAGRIEYLTYLNETWAASGEAGSIYDPGVLFGKLTYEKSATVVHALRRQLGDEVFFPALRDHLDTYAGGAHDTEMLRASLEAASGQDLGPFFDLWIYGEPSPGYTVTWAAQTVDGITQLDLDVSQTGGGPGFFASVPVTVSTGQGEEALLLDVSEQAATTRLCLDSPVSGVEADPEYDLIRASLVQFQVDPPEFSCAPAEVAGGCGCSSTGAASAVPLLGALSWMLRSRRVQRR